MGHLIHIMFVSGVEFSGSAHRVLLLPVGLNPTRRGCRKITKIKIYKIRIPLDIRLRPCCIGRAAGFIRRSHVCWRQRPTCDVIGRPREPGCSRCDVRSRWRLSRLPAQRVSTRWAVSVSASGRRDFRPTWRHSPAIVEACRVVLSWLPERSRLSPGCCLQVRVVVAMH